MVTDHAVQFFVLGPTELHGPDGAASLLRQPKRLALLAYLALETAEGYRRRDAVVAMFWPEHGQSQARAQLRKALHALRDCLGVAAVETRGEDEIRLNPSHVWCDVLAFGRAVQGGDWASAQAFYRGELLEGLFAAGVAQEFEDWIARQRRALREQAARAALELSGVAEAGGELRSAVAQARRALGFEPDDEATVRVLIRLLDKSGDRAGALRTYAEWQARLHDEFGVAPAPETRKIAHHVEAMREGESHETPPALPPVPARHGEIVPLVGARRPWRVRILWGVGAIVGIPILLWSATQVGRPAGPRPTPPTLSVLPVRPIGGLQLEPTARGLSEELVAALTQASELALRSPACSGEQGSPVRCVVAAAYYVDGSVRQDSNRIRVTLQLIHSADVSAIWAGTFDGDAGRILETQQLIASRAAREIRTQLRATSQP